MLFVCVCKGYLYELPFYYCLNVFKEGYNIVLSFFIFMVAKLSIY